MKHESYRGMEEMSTETWALLAPAVWTGVLSKGSESVWLTGSPNLRKVRELGRECGRLVLGWEPCSRLGQC